jgi:hypothetical protein
MGVGAKGPALFPPTLSTYFYQTKNSTPSERGAFNSPFPDLDIL